MRVIIVLCVLMYAIPLSAQQLYFPPSDSNEWETITPESLNWDTQKLESLMGFLEEQNSKSFILLKDGKIVVEQYFGDFDQQSIWYWASAGKTITAFLAGTAKQDGLLDFNQPVSDYLGQGWTSMEPELELAITVWHQLTMTTGLDYNVNNQSCTDPSCLQYLADPGTQWFYHNAPYTLISHVIESVTETGVNDYATEKLLEPTGMDGEFIEIGFNRVFISKPRSMARFGLLVLNNGKWDETTVLDSEILAPMLETSQDLNEAYGYLWWLNGTNSFIPPTFENPFPGMMVPDAPYDMISGLGLNSQYVSVIPSENLVLIRMGDEPEEEYNLFTFYREVWTRLSEIANISVSVPVEPQLNPEISIYPNPTNSSVRIEHQFNPSETTIRVFDYLGREMPVRPVNGIISVNGWASGVYYVRIETPRNVFTERFTVIK